MKSTRTVGQNINSGLIAGAIAAVIYIAISSFFYRSLSRQIIIGGLLLGLFTLVATFVISRVISVWKAKQQ